MFPIAISPEGEDDAIEMIFGATEIVSVNHIIPLANVSYGHGIFRGFPI
jgi:hypothetical protein